MAEINVEINLVQVGASVTVVFLFKGFSRRGVFVFEGASFSRGLHFRGVFVFEGSSVFGLRSSIFVFETPDVIL